jgi:hypothetical protein
MREGELALGIPARPDHLVEVRSDRVPVLLEALVVK